MSYRTYNIIVKIENDKTDIKEYLSNHFRFFNIRKFHEPFNGFICQANEKWKDFPYEKFPDNYFSNQEEVENYFDYEIEDKIRAYSKNAPEKDIAFVDVDCFGGRCTSDGFIIKNQEKTFEQDPHHSGHKNILQNIYPEYNSWFFYPFTRTFFTDKGGINGDIINFSFAAIWLSVNQEFGNHKDYDLQATGNEMYLDCPDKFNLYFMKINDNWAKIMGSILVDDKELFEEVKEIIEDLLLGMEYNVEINNFENGESSILTTIDNAKNKEIKATSYRATAFNTQTIDLSNPNQAKSENTSQNKKKGFFKRLFGK